MSDSPAAITPPASETALPPLQLKRHEDRRIREGHCWVYSNEVDTRATPLTTFAPGDAVDIQASDGRWLGSGYVNPHPLICARVVSRDREHPLSRSLLVHRLNVALSLRDRLYPQPYYRAVYGESDGLPGLVIDRYGDIAVVQTTTAGMDRYLDDVVGALQKTLRPTGVLLKNDLPVRALENLEDRVEILHGDVPEQVEIGEYGAKFISPLAGGQKTGWYFDQRDNRGRLRDMVKDRSVLDLFSYAGAWGVQAAVNGAKEVLCVDSSRPALEIATENARRNGVADRVSVMAADAFTTLKDLRGERRRFDVVILDPPAFVKRKKDAREGTLAYERINRAAMQVLERDGLLVSCSCSYHFSRDDLLGAVRRAGLHIDRSVQIVAEGHQSADHPIHPAMPETAYLKAFFARVLPRF